MSDQTQNEARIVDGRNRDFFIVDNPVIDQKIERVEAKRRADVGWTYAVLCRLADNNTGEATLKISYLENKTGRSKPVLIECLKWLVKLGLLAKRENRKNGRQAPSTYVLLSVSRVKDDNPEAEVQRNQEEDSRVNTDNRITKTVSSTKTIPPTAASDEASEESNGVNQNNWFGFFCDLAKSLDVIITPEDRKETAGNFKALQRTENPSEAEMKKVVSKVLEARANGYEMSPQKALGKVRGNNVTPLRAVEPARPRKRVIS